MRHTWWLGLALLIAAGCGGSEKKVVTPGAMPPNGTFSGVWFSPQYGEMHMVQTGATVVGKYEKNERTGRIQGHVTGDLLRFQWVESRELIAGRPTETKGHGYFRIVHDDVEDSFKFLGEWGHDQEESGGGPWTGVKSKKRRPNIDGGSASSSSPASSESSGMSDFEENQAADDWDEEPADQMNDDLGDL